MVRGRPPKRAAAHVRGWGAEPLRFLRQPVFQAEDDKLMPSAIAAKGARRVEQLLENLVVGREIDPQSLRELFTPKPERVFQRFRREGRSSRKVDLPGGRRSLGSWPIQERQGDAGEFPETSSIGGHDLDGAVQFRRPCFAAIRPEGVRRPGRRAGKRASPKGDRSI